jgi:hypothetical protein
MDREKIIENPKDKIHSLVKEEYSGIAKGDAVAGLNSNWIDRIIEGFSVR